MLKSEVSSVKTENRSLKNTVKKLLGQLTDAIAERNELLSLTRRHQEKEEQQQHHHQQRQWTPSADGLPPKYDDDEHTKTLPPLGPTEEVHNNAVDEKDGDGDVVAKVLPFPIPPPSDDVAVASDRNNES